MSWILTYTGKRFDPTLPNNQIDIVDIAHALSHMPRFAGHTERLYSVAQHSIIVSTIVQKMGHSPIVQLEGLLHDATEAYMMDLPMPIKRLPELAAYRDLEGQLAERIYAHFEIRQTHDAVIKAADIISLATEARDLMGDPQDWPSIQGIDPLSTRLTVMTSGDAKSLFLERYLELKEKLR